VWGNVRQASCGQKKGPVEDGSDWIHPKLTGGSLATSLRPRKHVEKPRKIHGPEAPLKARRVLRSLAFAGRRRDGLPVATGL
jgi:hypothetical protein